MSMSPVIKWEIITVNNKLKLSKSTDMNKISIWLIKQYSEGIFNPLIVFINDSFESGVFPEILKTGKVIPIFKNGNAPDLNNLHPISFHQL